MAAQVRFTPEMFINYFVKQRNISVEEIGVAPTVIGSWSGGLIRSLVKATGATVSEHWLYGTNRPLYTGRVHGKPVSFICFPVGAPGSIMMMEEMIACGAKTFIGVGFAGSLQPHIPIGSFIIPTHCIAEEGTSKHYTEAGEVEMKPSTRLLDKLTKTCRQAGRKYFTGLQWTTDAIYQEYIDKIERYREQGVLGVDMETSAMYALGQLRNVEVCNLLVVSDEVWHNWNPGFHGDALQEAVQAAQKVVLQTIS
ncbi:nucleoside phosphorylase [Caldalkalibacillus thermarum TA2.A1]|uniref:Uridine phosphorylase n=1 Tax=Caldalkalibacillus thermarum (strain TA2.A1) TaxID=986075 RepID=A0A8X8IA67_CALTT|nr:nucleoside phosphorylase [Caldalkalibacillus thermarum]QZT33866.1 nucleoside phosphorylase [Caldalkalibacillus thermarum TA2.A1]